MTELGKADSATAMEPCWSCRDAVSTLALFCAHCGVIQPPSHLDHFRRLGLHRHYAVDPAELDRHYAGFSQRLRPDRFAGRSAKEQRLAERQQDGLTEAYETLQDPLRRAIYLLRLAGRSIDVERPTAVDDHDLLAEIAELRRALAAADGRDQAQQVAARIETEALRCRQLLGEAFAVEELDVAAALTMRLGQLAKLTAEAASRQS